MEADTRKFLDLRYMRGAYTISNEVRVAAVAAKLPNVGPDPVMLGLSRSGIDQVILDKRSVKAGSIALFMKYKINVLHAPPSTLGSQEGIVVPS